MCAEEMVLKLEASLRSCSTCVVCVEALSSSCLQANVDSKASDGTRKFRRSPVQLWSPFKVESQASDGRKLQPPYNSSRGTLRWMLSCHFHKLLNVDERSGASSEMLAQQKFRCKAAETVMMETFQIFTTGCISCCNGAFIESKPHSSTRYSSINCLYLRSHTSFVIPSKSLFSSIPEELRSGRSRATSTFPWCCNLARLQK